MKFKLIKTTVILVLFLSQVTWGQISEKDCINITRNVIKDIESDSIDDAMFFFDNPTEVTKNEIKKAILRFNSLNVQTTMREAEFTTKNYIINRCVYKDGNKKTQLMLNFYYKKDNEEALIEKIEVYDKSRLNKKKSNLSKSDSNKFRSASGPPPPAPGEY